MDDDQIKALGEDIKKSIIEGFKEAALALPQKEAATPKEIYPTDVELFFRVIPGIVGGLAGKLIDGRSTNACAFGIARELVGQACSMGICRATCQLSDHTFLGTMTQPASVPGVAGPMTARQDMTNRGVMVQEFPTPGAQAQPQVAQQVAQQVVQPGMQQPVGSPMPQQVPQAMAGQPMMQPQAYPPGQYPMTQQPAQQGVVGQGGVVAMFPTPPQSTVFSGGVQGAPLGQPMQGGMKAVVVATFPNDPTAYGQPAPQQAAPVYPGMQPQMPMQPGMQPGMQPMAGMPMQPGMQQPMQQPMQGMPPGYPPGYTPQPPPGFQPQQPIAPQSYAQQASYPTAATWQQQQQAMPRPAQGSAPAPAGAGLVGVQGPAPAQAAPTPAPQPTPAAVPTPNA
jgi:hypothetical protein